MKFLTVDNSFGPVNSVLIAIARVILGVVLIAHGWQKFNEWTIAGTTASFEGMGVPAASIAAPAAALIELVGGVLILIGLLTKVVAALVALEMAGAWAIAHSSAGIFVGDGGWELVGVILVAALMLVAAGPGRLSVDAALFKPRAA